MARSLPPVPHFRSLLPCLLLAFLWWSWLGPAFLGALRPEPGRPVDFYQDWASARNFLEGQSVYTPHETSVPRHLGLAWPHWLVQVNAHPPTSVLVALPFSALEFPEAVLAWNLVSLAALAVGAVVVGWELCAPPGLVLPGFLLLAFGHPLYANLHLGQWAVVLGVLIAMAWVLDRRGRPILSGVLIGVAASLKLFPVILLVVYAARREWRPVAASLATIGVLALTTAVALGPAVYVDYVRDVIPAQRVFWGLTFNLSLTAFWHRLFDPVGEMGQLVPIVASPEAARLATLACDAVVVGLAWSIAAMATTRVRRDAAWSAAIAMMLLVAPVTWEEGLLQALVPLAWLASTTWYRPTARALLGLVFVIFWLPPALLIALAPATWGGAGRPYSPEFSLTFASLKTYALLLSFALSCAATGLVESKQNTQITILRVAGG